MSIFEKKSSGIESYHRIRSIRCLSTQGSRVSMRLKLLRTSQWRQWAPIMVLCTAMTSSSRSIDRFSLSRCKNLLKGNNSFRSNSWMSASHQWRQQLYSATLTVESLMVCTLVDNNRRPISPSSIAKGSKRNSHPVRCESTIGASLRFKTNSEVLVYRSLASLCKRIHKRPICNKRISRCNVWANWSS